MERFITDIDVPLNMTGLNLALVYLESSFHPRILYQAKGFFHREERPTVPSVPEFPVLLPQTVAEKIYSLIQLPSVLKGLVTLPALEEQLQFMTF